MIDIDKDVDIHTHKKFFFDNFCRKKIRTLINQKFLGIEIDRAISANVLNIYKWFQASSCTHASFVE